MDPNIQLWEANPEMKNMICVVRDGLRWRVTRHLGVSRSEVLWPADLGSFVGGLFDRWPLIESDLGGYLKRAENNSGGWISDRKESAGLNISNDVVVDPSCCDRLCRGKWRQFI
ncbi:OLC1v1015976C1 [Oldenlandia corymbosa var. corymbosa]|uniref:OLC1v1015976C1 n=1 Tax=Oldenlandia corymbosa var. corymbosa TaxID=529605 RepID=A0AAV1E775_OLDCO|nr:OLC1v1015976C1 [Oldenlandia corymbosa var. corymbosa]